MEKLNKKITIGRRYWELPAILSIADGSNSIPLHILAARTIEKAGGITETAQTVNLRKFLLANHFILNHLQEITSALPSFLGIKDISELKRGHAGLYENILSVNRFALDNIAAVSGRTVRPLANSVGGFIKLPETEYFKQEKKKAESEGADLLKLFAQFTIPKDKKGIYAALRDSAEYTFYDGDLWTSRGQIIPLNKIDEYSRKNWISGPRARLAINKDKQDILKEFNLPSQPTATLAVVVELLHFLRYSNQLSDIFRKDKIRNEAIQPAEISGSATCAIESTNKLFILRLTIDKGIIDDTNLLSF